MTTYDAIVIGAGSTGENVGQRIARKGFTVAIVEEGLVGGDCSYYACVPSKALLRPAQALADVRAVQGAAAAVSGDLDVAGVLARRDGFTGGWDDRGALPWLERNRLALHRGRARLDGERRVVVRGPGGDEVLLEARFAVVVATGSDPFVPDIPGLRAAAPWTNREGTSAEAVPARLAVLGGGPVGCELATAWAALGSAVTIVVREPRLLPGLEPFVGEAVGAALARAGVTVVTGATTNEVARQADGSIVLTLDTGAVEADELLVATGRRARTADLGLETVGLEPGAWLPVDRHHRVVGVGGGWLHAAGDVTHAALLTHMGKYQARACGDLVAAVAQGDRSCLDAGDWSPYATTALECAVPQVVFTDPEAMAVGMTAHQAEEAPFRSRAVDYEIGKVAGAALHADGYTGTARMVVDLDRSVVVGVTMVGPGVGELLHAATIAIVGEVPLERLWHAVPAFPTMSEIWLRLLEALGL